MAVMDYTRAEWATLTPEQRGPCEEYQGCRSKRGYGRTEIRRFGKIIRQTHVVAWIDAHGCLPPPETPYICHHCDNPPCRNVEHLFAGTQKDNMADMVAKGRLRSSKAEWTECPRGHEFTPENTYITPYGRRKCRACQRMLRRTEPYRARHREEVARAWRRKHPVVPA